MMSLTPPLPPSVPSDAAILGAMALLAALGKAANSQATLDTMATAKREIDQAISANNAALREATEAQAALSDLEARAQDVASREAALAAAQTQLSGASAAVKERERGLTSRAAELDQRETELAAREKSLADRVEAYRRALA
jgi:uncharacterized protein (DUF3084 family)